MCTRKYIRLWKLGKSNFIWNHFLCLYWTLFPCFKGDFLIIFVSFHSHISWYCSYHEICELLLVHSYKLKVVSIVFPCSVKKTNCPITNFGIVRESHISLRAFPHTAWCVWGVSCTSASGVSRKARAARSVSREARDSCENFSFSYK